MEFNIICNKINNLIIFNPSRWPARETIGRITALTFVVIFLYLKIVKFKYYPGYFHGWNKFWMIHFFTWAIETGILLGYMLSYLTRDKAISTARGIMETVFPIFIAGLPVLISFASYNFNDNIPHESSMYLPAYFIVASLMLFGNLINFTGLLSLRRSFTIMSEARVLITSGLYKYIRHPLYLGHFILFFCSTLFRFHWYTVIMYLIFFFGQWHRAKIEEQKLEKSFSNYSEYKKKTGMFLPKCSLSFQYYIKKIKK